MYNWDPSKFQARRSSGHWDSVSNQRMFLEELVKKLHLKDKSGWYTVSKKTLTEHGGDGLLHKYHGSFRKLLTTVYSEYLRKHEIVFLFIE